MIRQEAGSIEFVEVTFFDLKREPPVKIVMLEPKPAYDCDGCELHYQGATGHVIQQRCIMHRGLQAEKDSIQRPTDTDLEE